MNKQFFGIIIVIVIGLFGVLMLTNKNDKNPASTAASQSSNHVVGAGTKNVTLLEYGDFQCPACKAYAPIVQQIKAEYGDQIKFQFRHFPLTQIHPNAFIGSRGAEAAGLQGKFFEMHDLLYENQDAWSKASDPSAVLDTFATQLGLNVDQFRTDMKSEQVAGTINADIKEAQAVGTTSTPTFVLNGKKIDKNPTSYEDFKKLIDDEIAAKNPS